MKNDVSPRREALFQLYDGAFGLQLGRSGDARNRKMGGVLIEVFGLSGLSWPILPLGPKMDAKMSPRCTQRPQNTPKLQPKWLKLDPFFSIFSRTFFFLYLSIFFQFFHLLCIFGPWGTIYRLRAALQKLPRARKGDGDRRIQGTRESEGPINSNQSHAKLLFCFIFVLFLLYFDTPAQSAT